MRGLYVDSGGFLQRLNPLTKVVATAPPLGLLAFTRDPWIPAAFILGCLTLTAIGGRVGLRRLALVVAPMSLLLVGFTLVYPLAAAESVTAGTRLWLTIGPVEIRQGGVELGVATGLRILSLVGLTLVFVFTTDGTDFIRALVQRWKLPYRIGYTALAAFRFVPRFRHELVVIAAAHRVRGLPDERGPRAQLRRGTRYAVPLLAGGIRHAERVALAMDARAFGAHPTRTYRRQLVFAPRDLAFVAAFWAASVGIVVTVASAGLMAPLTLWN